MAIGLGGGNVGGATIRINTREVAAGQTTAIAQLRGVGLAEPITFGRFDAAGNATIAPDGTVSLNTALVAGETVSFIAYAADGALKGAFRQFILNCIPTLGTITLDASSYVVNSVAGTAIGDFVGRTVGSTLYVNDARVTVSSDNTGLVVSDTAVGSVTSFDVDIEETWTDGSLVLTNTSTVTISTTAAPVSIATSATLSASTVPEGSAVDTLVGRLQVESGVTPTLANDGGGYFKIVGSGPWDIYTTATPLDFETTPTVSIRIAQAKAGATNDGVQNDITITVTFVYVYTPSLDYSDANNSQYFHLL